MVWLCCLLNTILRRLDFKDLIKGFAVGKTQHLGKRNCKLTAYILFSSFYDIQTVYSV